MTDEVQNSVGERQPAAAGRRNLLSETPESLGDVLAEWGQPGYRTKQVFEWVYGKDAASFDEMSNLPQSLRAQLTEAFEIPLGEVATIQHASDETIKQLLRWHDGRTSECVMIPDIGRRTACISSQVGCPVGCVFCASGLGGLDRQLSAGEIVAQALRVRSVCDERLSNVVFMGLGEPLANYDNTVRALRTINADWGLGIGARKITVSTVGLPKQMRRLADEGLQITLALSLHAPTDDLRQKLIPWAERVAIGDLVDACKYYFDRTGREVTLEYILLAGENDRREHARELAKLARDMRSHINLIAYNPVESLPYGRPDGGDVDAFLTVLRNAGINAHVRRSRGLDIDAACGQLRRRHEST